MATPLAVLASDWHLAPGAWARYPGLRGDAYFGLQQAADLCVQRRLPLLAPGDLFDVNHPDARSVGVAMVVAAQLHLASLPLYFLQGQHDATRDLPWLALHPHPRHMHAQALELSGLTFRFLDYQPVGDLARQLDALAAGPAYDVLVAHQPWRETMGTRAPLESSLAAVTARAVISGDLHKTLVRTFPGRDGPLLFVSPGCLSLQSIDEPEDKYALVLYDDLSVERVRLRTRPVYRLDLTGPEAADGAWKDWLAPTLAGMAPGGTELPEELCLPILHARCPTELADVYTALRRLCAGRFHLFYTPVEPASVQDNGYAVGYTDETGADEADEDDVLEAALLEACPDPADAPVRAAVSGLLRTPEVCPQLLAQVVDACLAGTEG